MENDADQEHPITTGDITAAEKLIGFSFTEGERAAMLPLMQKRRSHYESIRAIPLANAVPPALRFDPRIVSGEPHPAPPRQYPPLPSADVTVPANFEDVAFYPVTQLAHLLRTRQITSVQLTELYLERLRRYSPRLQCTITVMEDRALESARRADAEMAAGQYRSPLHGIPWGAKDLIAAKGYPTTWGAAPYRDQRFDADATVVEHLDAAGAVLIAKLVTGELAHGDKWFGGQTKNPWNIAEGSSGSSAGPVSATAAGLVGFALGTETTGSIVWPALRCGVVGLRPTFGRVSRHGVMVLSWTMDKVGPVARTVEDCALIMTAIYGADGKDAFAFDEPLDWNVDLAGVRVGYVRSAFDASNSSDAYDHATVAALHKMGIDLREHRGNDLRTLDTLRALGFELVPIDLPKFDLDALLLIMSAEGAAAFDELTRSNQDDLLVAQDESNPPNLFRQARFIPVVEYLLANRIRTQLMQAMAAVMKQVDVFVVPQLAESNLSLTNLTGQPTIGVPNGFTDDGMPTGINFIGRVCGEANLVAVAAAYQNATGYWKQHPALNF
ncbi:MAG: amidase [Anaerolineae bacterium]|nr:amidase [Anaerolineae bacterium]